ncbi:hypothetical protein K493DRAFT_281807 [Basidiobolus meristosporus CBS 931.73]|uniref:GATA-domain-containing protein n=1 Tax=Basidiobolus meristosporus CBS 931.73 TaxID=1314790 RepID=A0A1Y1YF50_9FUNG|nr:hypothetical protein K493DRAFT_281807 [Basidiobolus meristosporus CBS 931.73]|eukprot:ORX96629.1 hypothetical protein K493DRAFT_281807 [Basidiobolus meristosporus CBS 931.73]
MYENVLDLVPNSPIPSTVSQEFTKRKNWSNKLLNEIKDFYHVTTPEGKILYCSASCQELVGFQPDELVGRNIKEFLHVDDVDCYLRELTLARPEEEYRLFLRFRRKDDRFVMFEVLGRPYFTNLGELKCYFNMARQYPAKATSAMDSFLELKMENERLRRQLAELGVSIKTPEPADSAENSANAELVHKPPTSIELEPRADLDQATASNLENLLAKPKRRSQKKPKESEQERVCTECGTVDSPEWRKGPQGPKTLCNACGLRWSKLNRRQSIPEPV